MGKDPSDIRAEIEQTRARVGDEADALSYKTDVPARVGDYVDDKKEAVKVGRVKDTAERNPVGLALAGAAYVLAKQGKERVEEAGSPLPEQTIETVKEDVEWAKTRATSARK